MALRVGCPRCDDPVTPDGDDVRCDGHGAVPALWRPDVPTYDDFWTHLRQADRFPTWLPWPLPPGWRVSGFARVGGATTLATMCRVTGATAVDGAVEVCVVSEERGTGLGARCAGLDRTDPGPEVGRGAPVAQVRVGRRPVPLWPLTPPLEAPETDRSVLVGEALGRWLWVVITPASAALLLGGGGLSLRDAAGLGPALLEVEFGDPGRAT